MARAALATAEDETLPDAPIDEAPIKARRKRKSAPRQPTRLFLRVQVLDENKQPVTFPPRSTLNVLEIARPDVEFTMKFWKMMKEMAEQGSVPEGLFAIVEVPRTGKEDGEDENGEDDTE